MVAAKETYGLFLSAVPKIQCASSPIAPMVVRQRETVTYLHLCLEAKIIIYRKNSKNWDTLNYYRDCPTNGIVAFYSAILRSKDADRITNRVDTDQTAP